MEKTRRLVSFVLNFTAKSLIFSFLCLGFSIFLSVPAFAQPPSPGSGLPPGVVVEAEDFVPRGTPGSVGGNWNTLFNGQGNSMVDIIGHQHISGERVLSAPAQAKEALASAKIQLPAPGDYRLWARFEQPTNAENRFRVEVRQGKAEVQTAVMGQRDAPKFIFGAREPDGQADASWGSEGLAEQSFDLRNLQAGEAEITLVAVDQSALPGLRADRNVDFLFLTQDMTDGWRSRDDAGYYAILDAAGDAMPPRYYLRLTSPLAQTLTIHYIMNRVPWFRPEATTALEANVPGEWIPLRGQDVSHYSTLAISGPAGKGLQLRAEFASAPDAKKLIRAVDWNDPECHDLLVGLPPYPGKYPGEKIVTVEEQYRDIASFLKLNPSRIGKDPVAPLGWGGWIPVWERGRVGDAAADVYFGVGLRLYGGNLPLEGDLSIPLSLARERFAARDLVPTGRSISLGAYRSPPTPENIAKAKEIAERWDLLPRIQRFDYGDEIGFSEWLSPLTPEQLQARFATWQQEERGGVRFRTPDSSSAAAARDAVLYVDSQEFYEDTALSYVASLARRLPETFGPDLLYGANVSAHPFYYPEIAKYVKWFRPTEEGHYAANFGRHSEYFWQIGQPGPLVNAYIADHFSAGMRRNPQAVLLQYTMPHSPGNSDASFRRTAFSHLAHGARGLDYFGVGLNHSFTENYIDFRDPQRFAAIRDINRSMATIEDILPRSRPVPTKVALILSESTERWDMSGIALDKAAFDVFGDSYKKARLAYHQERVGLYYALVHNSRPPDLLIEEDVQQGALSGYEVAYWVGDCAMPKTVSALRSWVEDGGHLVATAGALRNDHYNRPSAAGNALLGLQTASLGQKQTFFRPQIELPRLAAIDRFGAVPALAFLDTVTPATDAKVVESFASGKPAVVEHTLGKGRTTFFASLPGVGYLWSAYQKAGGKDFVSGRGPSSHRELDGFSPEIGARITGPARAVQSAVEAPGSWIDARLIKSPAGYAIPFANYSPNPKAPVTLILRVPGIASIHSAAVGKLEATRGEDDSLTIQYAPGYGDILRLEP